MLVRPNSESGENLTCATHFQQSRYWSCQDVPESHLLKIRAGILMACHELPQLLAAAQTRGLTILWVAISASLYRETEIAHYQAANDPAVPLDSMSVAEQNRQLVKVCEKIRDVCM